MPSLLLPGLCAEYAEYGDPHGAPVLLLHGFPDSAAGWRALVAAWQGEPVRFIAPSLRGHAATTITDPEAASGEVAALAEDALNLLEALGIERAVVVGHDWGARAAYAAAVLRPERVRAVVGLASEYVAQRATGELPHDQARAYWYQWFFHTPQGEQSLTRDRAGLCRYLWQLWSPGWHFAEPEFTRASEAWNNPQFVATVLSYYRTRYGNAPGAARYAAQQARLNGKPSIAVPTWFLTGLADTCNHAEGSLGQEAWFTGPYARVELPEVGHFVQHEAPGAVAEVLQAALTQTR